MIYGSTKTKLDYIVENGCMRIDAAIEKVIAKYPAPEPIVTKYEFNLANPQGARQSQRDHNLQLSLLVQQAALAPIPRWQRQSQFQNQGASLSSPLASLFSGGRWI